ncbi:leucine-rich repeat protein [Butyrivibrio sp. JL13D10]|uniref:leucine-rich repeat protein n=1 Tax=Butyrivibrio sp. JL13D10 TaxID=3236815 RepID=UPI0038B6510B
MKKRMITGLLAAVMAITLAVPAGGIKAEAKTPAELTGFYCFKEHEEELYSIATQIVTGAPATPHEKVKYFHDEICKKTKYSLNITAEESLAYGSLVKGKTKCTGYSNALSLLCELADIPCKEVIGYCGDVPHMWNIVQLEDGEWYEVDVTADDEYKTNNYLLVTTEEMNKDHKRNNPTSDNEGVPIAKGTLYAYNKKAIKVGDAKYKVTDAGKVEYTEAIKSAKGNITIPETVTIGNTTYEVTSIAKNAFKGNKKIKKVTIGKNIETIGSGAFSNCPNLKSVDMSKCRVNTLSKNLFKGSKKLSKLSINGENVTSVGKNAVKNIATKCKITITGTNKNSGLVRSLKKQGAKKAKFIFK